MSVDEEREQGPEAGAAGLVLEARGEEETVGASEAQPTPEDGREPDPERSRELPGADDAPPARPSRRRRARSGAGDAAREDALERALEPGREEVDAGAAAASLGDAAGSAASAPEEPEARAAGEAEAGGLTVGEPAADDGAEAEAPAGAGRAWSEEELLEGVSALVFASPEPLSLRRLLSLLEGPEPARVRAALAELARRLEQSGLPYELRELAGGWRILTHARAAEWISRLAGEQKVERISGAALETLAIVAYRQPVTKAEIEAIRGVQAGPILRTLIDRGLVRVAGRSDQPGHPLHYGTTREFLDRFGLARIEDLPRDGELAED